MSEEIKRGEVKESSSLELMAQILLFIGIIGLAAYYRFFDIFEMGIRGHDTFQYVDFSRRFVDGELYLKFYRPIAYLTNALSMQIFGFRDYAMLVPLAILDLIAVLLLFFLSLKIFRNGWLALIATSLYAFSEIPRNVIEACSIHGHSTAYILGGTLLFAYFLDRWIEKRKVDLPSILLVIFSGAFIALAAHTHEEIAMIGSAYVLSIIVTGIVLSGKRSFNPFSYFSLLWQSPALYSTLFVIGFVAVYLIGFSFVGFDTVLENMQSVQSGRTPSAAFSYHRHLIKLFNIFFYGVYGNGIATAFIFGLILSLVSFWNKGENEGTFLERPLILLCFLIPLSYWFFYGTLLGTRELSRNFIPFFSLGVLGATCGVFIVSRKFFPRHGTLITVVVGLLFIYADTPWRHLKHRKVFERKIYDALRPEITPESKILIPLSVQPKGPMWGGARAYGLSSVAYLGTDAVGLVDVADEKISIRKAVEKHNIKYIVFPATFGGPTKGGFSLDNYYKHLYGIDIVKHMKKRHFQVLPEKYRNEEFLIRDLVRARVIDFNFLYGLERHFLMQRLKKKGLVLKQSIKDVADIYELKG